MSLDITLKREIWLSYDEGKTHKKVVENVFDTNITHNLGKMAQEADIYTILWRPYKLKENYNIHYARKNLLP